MAQWQAAAPSGRARRRFGASALRRFGASALRRFGASALRRFGASALRHLGTSALRHFGTSALRHFGTSALRHFGTSAKYVSRLQSRKRKTPGVTGGFPDSGGVDGTRTRDLRRDRPAF